MVTERRNKLVYIVEETTGLLLAWWDELRGRPDWPTYHRWRLDHRQERST